MFAYPERAKVNRVLPKNKVYGHTQPSRALRQRFVDQVEEIVWRYKLAPDTINLPPGVDVSEIQVFSLALRTPDLREDILRTLDRVIPSLLFFELTFQGRVRFAAAYKRRSEADCHKQFVATYYWTPWQEASASRPVLPVAITIDSLYEQMLHRYMEAAGLNPRSGETLETTAQRGSRIRSQELICRKLEARLRKEVQFNRQVEINANLRQARAVLAELRQ